MKVVLIGSGNVATVLGKKIKNAGHEITQIIGRSVESTSLLSSTLNSDSSTNLLKINTECDLYILSVPDDHVAEIAKKLHLPGKLVVHTAGSLSRDILKNATSTYGVLYPLQSLRKETIKLPEIPIIVDGNQADVTASLINFSKPWAASVWQCGDYERSKLHVAAVVASNFTNHLYLIAESYCNHEALNFNMLLPLIKETAERVELVSPSILQTGPAIREDHTTIEKHLKFLTRYPHFKTIYKVMTESIMSFKTSK